MKNSLNSSFIEKNKIVAVATTLLTATTPVFANSIPSTTDADHTSAQIKAGTRVHARVDATFAEEQKPSYLLSAETTFGDSTFGSGIRGPFFLFANFKKELLKITDSTYLSGAAGVEFLPTEFKKTLKPGFAILLEHDFGPIQVGANGGMAYHFGAKSFYPSATIYSTIQVGTGKFSLEVFADIPFSRLKDETKETFFNRISNNTHIDPTIKNGDAVFGAQLLYALILSNNLSLNMKAGLKGNSRQNMHLNIGGGISWGSH